MENDVTNVPVVEQSPILDVVLDGDPAPEADAQNSDPAPAAEEQKAEESDEQKEARKQSRRERARAKSAADLAEARTEARMLKERLDRLERPPEVAQEPKRESFDSLEEYLEARADYRATQTAQKIIDTDRKSRAESEKQLRANDAYEETAKNWSAREVAFMKEAKDYVDVITPFIDSRTGELNDLSQAAKDAISESPLGPQLLYRLALDDASEAERIAKLSPTRQVIEIGKLEDKVIPPKKQSSAPAPVSKVKGASVMQGYHDNMSDTEYKNWRKANGARWAQ